MGRVSIIFADDHCMVRDFLRLAIQEDPGLFLICEAQDGLELMDQLKESIPDVVILDMSMPNMTGLQAAREIKNLYPGVKIIMLTMHQNKHLCARPLTSAWMRMCSRKTSCRSTTLSWESFRARLTYLLFLPIYPIP